MEMAGHLGYEKNSSGGDGRNGHTEKTALLENQGTAIEVPRGRDGTLGPAIAPKHGKRMPPFNDQIISTHPFGMSGRNIQKHLEQVYNVEASPGLISRVADGAIGEAGEWRNRPLEKSCAIACLDALRAKGREDGKSCNKSLREPILFFV
jgi:putative transposase